MSTADEFEIGEDARVSPRARAQVRPRPRSDNPGLWVGVALALLTVGLLVAPNWLPKPSTVGVFAQVQLLGTAVPDGDRPSQEQLLALVAAAQCTIDPAEPCNSDLASASVAPLADAPPVTTISVVPGTGELRLSWPAPASDLQADDEAGIRSVHLSPQAEHLLTKNPDASGIWMLEPARYADQLGTLLSTVAQPNASVWVCSAIPGGLECTTISDETIVVRVDTDAGTITES